MKTTIHHIKCIDLGELYSKLSFLQMLRDGVTGRIEVCKNGCALYSVHNTTILSKCEQGNIATVKLRSLPTHAENLQEYSEIFLEDNSTAKG